MAAARQASPLAFAPATATAAHVTAAVAAAAAVVPGGSACRPPPPPLLPAAAVATTATTARATATGGVSRRAFLAQPASGGGRSGSGGSRGGSGRGRRPGPGHGHDGGSGGDGSRGGGPYGHAALLGLPSLGALRDRWVSPLLPRPPPVTSVMLTGSSVLPPDLVPSLLAPVAGAVLSPKELYATFVEPIRSWYTANGYPFCFVAVVGLPTATDGAYRLVATEPVLTTIRLVALDAESPPTGTATGDDSGSGDGGTSAAKADASGEASPPSPATIKTRPSTVYRALGLRPGSVFRWHPDAFSRLLRLGVFEEVRVEAEPDGAGVALVLSVTEKRSGLLDPGIGIRSDGQVFGHVAISDTNWRGRGQLLRADWQRRVGVERPAGGLEFVDPRIGARRPWSYALRVFREPGAHRLAGASPGGGGGGSTFAATAAGTPRRADATVVGRAGDGNGVAVVDPRTAGPPAVVTSRGLSTAGGAALDVPRALSALVADGSAAAGHPRGGTDAGREGLSASVTTPAHLAGGGGSVTATLAVERIYPFGGGVSETVSVVQPSVAVGLVHDRRRPLGVAGGGGGDDDVSSGQGVRPDGTGAPPPAATVGSIASVDGTVGVCQGVPFWKGTVKVGAASVPATWARRLRAAAAAASTAVAVDDGGGSRSGSGGGSNSGGSNGGASGGGGVRLGPLQSVLTLRAGTASRGLPPHERTAVGGGDTVRGWLYGRLGLVPAFGVATAELRLPLLASPGERGGVGTPPPSKPSPPPSAKAAAAGSSADQTTTTKEGSATETSATTADATADSEEPPLPSLWERVPSLTAVVFVDAAVTAESRRLSSVVPAADLFGVAATATTTGGTTTGGAGGTGVSGSRPTPPLTTIIRRGAAVGVGLHVAGAVGVDVAWPSSGGRAALSFRLLDRTF
ncbi:hypothetical protein MMPV_004702 [Pyropia vietnamensis]